MDVVFIAHDGEKLGWIENDLTIEAFDGAKKVCSLSCVPLDQLSDRDSICKQLGQRGQWYLELLSTPSGTYQEYLGPALTENRDVIVDDQFKKVTLHVSGRIMLDNLTFSQQNKYTDLLKPGVTDEIPGSYMTTTSMSEDDRLYCNHAIGGFAFRQKKWCMFPISDPHPVVWNADAFSKLVMDTKKRNLIHSLVKSHKHGPESLDDVVAGKGKGLVGLLSGSPGVGKTLTAEVIAEVTKRPLYMLSAGELGTCMDVVEEKLDMVLEMTRQWGCVLLIDEADVFLQERDGLDLERNALVSIFLRRLEYFQGVLIMTTNRKRTIDAAFDSRIHFKLHYQELDSESRYTIWKNCLENTPPGLEKGDIGEEDVRKLAELRLNGRQIKNAVACAVDCGGGEGSFDYRWYTCYPGHGLGHGWYGLRCRELEIGLGIRNTQNNTRSSHRILSRETATSIYITRTAQPSMAAIVPRPEAVLDKGHSFDGSCSKEYPAVSAEDFKTGN
jgi:hypothetical protein